MRIRRHVRTPSDPTARRHDARDGEEPAPRRAARAPRPTASDDRCSRHRATRSAGGSDAGRCHCASVASGIAITSASANASGPASARSVARISRAVASSAAATRDHSNIRASAFAPSAAARIAGLPPASRISTIHGAGASLAALDAVRDFAVARRTAAPMLRPSSLAQRHGRVRCRSRSRARRRPATARSVRRRRAGPARLRRPIRRR